MGIESWDVTEDRVSLVFGLRNVSGRSRKHHEVTVTDSRETSRGWTVRGAGVVDMEFKRSGPR